MFFTTLWSRISSEVTVVVRSVSLSSPHVSYFCAAFYCFHLVLDQNFKIHIQCYTLSPAGTEYS